VTGALLNEVREGIKQLDAATQRLRRFIQRVDRGDPRLCNPGFENPRYFEKFGDSE
jgi:hypothetical protein